MKLEDLGEIALRDYRPVRYFPFKNEAGSAFILTSEPFNYIEAFLSTEYSSVKRDLKKKKESLRKAIYFTKLSQDFYNSSLVASMPSKGTLLYYSFINLVKVYLISNGYDLEKKIEHHGLSLPPNSTDTLKLANLNDNGISIFHEFSKVLGRQIKNQDGVDISFSDLLRNLPEIHEISYKLPASVKSWRFEFIQISLHLNNQSVLFSGHLYSLVQREAEFFEPFALESDLGDFGVPSVGGVIRRLDR